MLAVLLRHTLLGIHYSGKIAAATETNVTLELEDGESVTLDFSDVKKCKLKPVYDFKPAKEGN